jgi:hypothetical protein
MASREWRQREGSRRSFDRLDDSPARVTPRDLRPGSIEALADKFSGRPFKDMLRDRDFKHLSETEVQALAAEFRRRADRVRAEAGAPASGTSRRP